APGTVPSRHAGSPGKSWLRAFLAPRLAWGFAAVTVSLIVVGGYLLRQNHSLRVELTQEQTQRNELEGAERSLRNELAERGSLDADAARELARTRDQVEHLEREAARHPQNPSRTSGKVAVFVLAAPTRGLDLPPTIDIPAGTDFVVLDLELEAENLQNFRAAIKDLETGEIIWQSGRLRVATRDRKKILALRLRANLLEARSYTIDLSGIGPGGDRAIAGTYLLRVRDQ
ncbi:MAG: hypothetical protein ACREDR_43315, partial [Blastocatellia bacterium]